MENVTLEQINRNILKLKEEVDRIRSILEESYLELEENVIEDIEMSRKKSKKDLISNEEMEKEFG